MARMQPERQKNMFKPTAITCNVTDIQEKFRKVEEGKRMIVHEQLSVMERLALLLACTCTLLICLNVA